MKHSRVSVPELLLSCLLLSAAALCIAAVSGCTFASYKDKEGRKLLLIDSRLSGTATTAEIVRNDGTRIYINRDQESPEATISGVINAATPLGGLTP